MSYFILSTQTGTQLALKALPYVSSYAIQYDTLSGTLSSGTLQFEGIHLQSPNIDLYAKKLDVSLSFYKLLTKKIDIQTLTIDTPSVIRSVEFNSPFDQSASIEQQIKTWINKIETKDTLSWKSLLPSYTGYDFSIENFSINHLHFVSGKQHYDIEHFTLNNLDSKNKNLFTQLDIKMPEINLHINLADKVQLNWAIQIKDLNQYIASLKGDLYSKGQWQSNENNDLLLNLTSSHLSIDSFTAKKLHLKFKGNYHKHSLNISFDQQQKKFEAELYAELNQTHDQSIWQGQIKKLIYTDPKYKNIQPTMAKFKLIFSAEKSFLSTDFNLWGNNHFNLEAEMSHAKPFNLNGHISGEIKDLALLSLWTNLTQSGDLHSLQGKGLLKLSLQGTLSQPKIMGELVFNKITSHLPKLNTHIAIEQLGFYELGSSKINIKAFGKMGKGDFQIEGYAKKDPIAPELKLTLKGSNLLVSNTSEYKVSISPNLSLTIDKHASLLSGQLYVPKAKITPRDNTEGIPESEDIVLVKNRKRVNTTSQSVQTFKKLKTNIEVVLGDQIFFEGSGLTTRAQGRVIIETRQDDTSKATGKINLINGRYGAYNHYFSLSHGQLVFQSDPILDPKVDIRAERVIKPNMRIKNNASVREDVIVGMQLYGRISKLQTKLYSNPHFNDREIISYLILGHGQNANTGADGEVLMEAVKQLTTAFYPKAKRLTEKKSFYDRLKLDWSIGHSPFDDESKDQLSDFERKYVNVGKRLSDKLYIQYSLGLADKVSVYSIQYLLGNHLILEAKTDSQSRTAADLLFTFESG